MVEWIVTANGKKSVFARAPFETYVQSVGLGENGVDISHNGHTVGIIPSMRVEK
jgi:hypothetical protein